MKGSLIKSIQFSPPIALVAGFYLMCFTAIAFQAGVMRDFEPMLGSAFNVVVVVMVIMLAPAAAMFVGAVLASSLMPRVIVQHRFRMLIISLVVGLANFWLLMGSLALRESLDSLVKPTDAEKLGIAMLLAFLIGASTGWLATRGAVGLGVLQATGLNGQRCRRCGYDLRRRPLSHKCPECGETAE